MAGETHAGSIFVELKAKYESAVAGMNKTKAAVEQVGASVQKTSQAVAAGGQGIARGMDAADKAAIRLSAKLARITGVMFSLQAVMGSFSPGSGPASKFTTGMGAAGNALTAFAGVALALPGPLGVALGAVVGLTAGAASLYKAFAEAEQKTADFAKKIKENLSKVYSELGKQDVNALMANGPIGRINNELEKQVARLIELRTKIRAAEGAIAETGGDPASGVGGQIASTQAAMKAQEGFSLQWKVWEDSPYKKLEKELARLTAIQNQATTSLGGLSQAQKQVFDDIARLNEELKGEEGLNAYMEGMSQLAEESAFVEAALKNGLITPMEKLQKNADLAAKALEKLIKNRDLLVKSSQVTGSVDAAIEAARLKLQQARLSVKVMVDMDEIIAAGATPVKPTKTKEEQEEEYKMNAVAADFGNAIGGAVYNGILEGKKAMEIVADVGKNLFATFIDNSIKQLQEGMAGAFKYAFGEAGSAVGGFVNAALGVAGAIYAARQNESDDAFDSVQSAIESSQAVRGIVAGPSSVAIASVGENIQRAFEPARALLAVAVQHLAIMSRAAQRGGGGAQGTPYPSVATS